MRPPFLSTPRVRLVPVEDGDEAALARAPWRLLSPGAAGDLIVLTAVDAEDRPVGSVRLEAIDWVSRRASLTLRWSGSLDAAREATDAMLRYADVELRLDGVDARTLEADPDWGRLLGEAGFAPTGTEGVVPGAAVLRHDKAFASAPR